MHVPQITKLMIENPHDDDNRFSEPSERLSRYVFNSREVLKVLRVEFVLNYSKQF
jgi:hypothetical protein